MLKLTQVSKSFGGIRALKEVSLKVRVGEIHALLGENGAGKSTLMKIISGAHRADTGEMVFNGQPITHNNPQLAKSHGISIIYQEFSLVPELSVSENIFLGKPQGSAWLNRKAMDEKANAIIQSIGFDLDVRKKVAHLSVAQQQVVEIAKALSQDVKLLILDEPSAVLGTAEVKKLFALLRRLRSEGVAIIYISHHLDELLELTDRVTVLKDGRSVATVDTQDTDNDKLVHLMVGRELTQLYPDKPARTAAAETISVTGLVTRVSPQPLSFEIRKGEILGLGGLVGAGRTEVLEALFGLSGKQAGEITQNGKPIRLPSPRKAVKAGWGMVSEDRKQFGSVINLSIRDNISLANLSGIANRWGFINGRKEATLVDELVERLRIKVDDVRKPLATLSGGNQQKVILAKWLNMAPNVLLIDEPTRGVDVGARVQIYQIIQALAEQGLYIVMVSSDADELMGLADRIIVMKNGKVQGSLERPQFSEEKLLRMAIGAD